MDSPSKENMLRMCRNWNFSDDLIPRVKFRSIVGVLTFDTKVELKKIVFENSKFVTSQLDIAEAKEIVARIDPGFLDWYVERMYLDPITLSRTVIEIIEE